MPEGVGYGPQNTASTGLDLNIIGNHAYAFSGSVGNVDQGGAATTPCLDFTTGAEYHVGTLGWLFNSESNADTFLKIQINNVDIFKVQYAGGYSANTDQPLTLIIPPFTNFKVLWGLEGTDNTAAFVWQSRVYK